MNPTSKFEILRRRSPLNQSGKFQSPIYNTGTFATLAAGTETAVRGLALGAHATDGESLDLAGGQNFVGFLTRRVTKGGLSLSDRVFGVTSATPVGLESPFADGEPVTVEAAEEIEVEGPNYIMTSGTGALSSGTTLPQSLSFVTGRLRIAQAGDVVYGTLMANNLTAMADGNNDLRIRVRMLA
jgi:hypothetical protein